VDTLTFLLGVWDLDRSIDDHRSGTHGGFAGSATLTPTPAGSALAPPDGAHYQEVGELQFGAYRGPARRALDYVRRDDGSVLLCFTDGRPFIDLDLRSGDCHRSHDCGQDRHEIGIVVISSDTVEEHWQVRGPGKDYVAITTLHRRVDQPTEETLLAP
jgi:hypothetical protein